MLRWLGHQNESEMYLIDAPIRLQVTTVASFMHFAWKVLGLKASTIISSLSGIRHQFRTNLLSLDVFEHASVRACKTALTLEERSAEGAVAVNRRHPVTVDMLHWIVQRCLMSGHTLDAMVGAGILLAFFCLLRTSEYVPNRRSVMENACHALKASDVWFELIDKDGNRVMVESYLVIAEMWDNVSLVKFVLRSAKNDKLRVGSTFWFKNEPSENGVNVVEIIFTWVCRANLAPTDFLFSCRANPAAPSVWLTYDRVAKAIKSCACAFGLNPAHYGTYSARVGGACTLRAGGASDSLIQMMGRWKSMSSCLIYQETSRREYSEAQRILSDPTVFTAEDSRLIHDRVNTKKG
jgi:hypothetical protein